MNLRTAAIPRYRLEVSIFHWLLACAFAEALLFTLFGVVNRDEGWYLYAGRLVYDGKVPYRDFAFFQGPVLPYLYGFPQWLFGPSLLVGRLTSLVLILASFALLVRVARMIAGPSAGNWTLGLLCFNPALLSAGTLARSEAATTLLCAVALLCFYAYRRGTPALLLAPAALLLASGARIIVLPTFLVMTALIWWRTPATARERLIAAGALVGELALIAMPLLLSPRRAVFDLWSSQMWRSSQWLPSADRDQLADLISRLRDMQSVWAAYFVLVVPLIALLAYLMLRAGEGWRPQWPKADGDPLSNYLMISGLAALMFLPYLGASPFEPRYFVPSSAYLTVVVAAAAVQLPMSRGLEAFRPFFARLLLLLLMLAAPFYLAQSQIFFRFRHPDLMQTRDVAEIVASHLDKGDELMTFDATLAVEADRPLMPRLEMAQFSYWPRMELGSAASRGVLNQEQLRGALSSGIPKVVAFTEVDLLIIALDTDPSLASASRPPPLNVLPELAVNYKLDQTISNYGQFRDKLYIYVRTSPEPSPGASLDSAPPIWGAGGVQRAGN